MNSDTLYNKIIPELLVNFKNNKKLGKCIRYIIELAQEEHIINGNTKEDVKSKPQEEEIKIRETTWPKKAIIKSFTDKLSQKYVVGGFNTTLESTIANNMDSVVSKQMNIPMVNEKEYEIYNTGKKIKVTEGKLPGINNHLVSKKQKKIGDDIAKDLKNDPIICYNKLYMYLNAIPGIKDLQSTYLINEYVKKHTKNAPMFDYREFLIKLFNDTISKHNICYELGEFLQLVDINNLLNNYKENKALHESDKEVFVHGEFVNSLYNFKKKYIEKIIDIVRPALQGIDKVKTDKFFDSLIKSLEKYTSFEFITIIKKLNYEKIFNPKPNEDIVDNINQQINSCTSNGKKLIL